jgi:hypothetical protein
MMPKNENEKALEEVGTERAKLATKPRITSANMPAAAAKA